MCDIFCHKCGKEMRKGPVSEIVFWEVDGIEYDEADIECDCCGKKTTVGKKDSTTIFASCIDEEKCAEIDYCEECCKNPEKIKALKYLNISPPTNIQHCSSINSVSSEAYASGFR